MIIEQGLSLMLLGMGIVFSFLAILIVSMSLTSKFINKFLPEKEEETAKPKLSGSGETEIALAIAAAKHYAN